MDPGLGLTRPAWGQLRVRFSWPFVGRGVVGRAHGCTGGGSKKVPCRAVPPETSLGQRRKGFEAADLGLSSSLVSFH